jgi:Peptidase family M1 domain
VLRGLAFVAAALVATVGATSTAPDVGAAEAACAVAIGLPSPPPSRPSYRLVVRPSRDLTDFTGTLSVTFAPEVATDRIVLRLWPNAAAFGRGARLTVGAVRVGAGRLATAQPDSTTLLVRRRLDAGERVTLSTSWRLHLSKRSGVWLRGGRPARLVAFFPLLAWDGSGWATDAPLRRMDSVWPTSPVADFDVRVTPPQGLRVLATGSEVGPGRWRARAVRSFAMAIGAFTVVRTTVRAPNAVAVAVGIDRGSLTPVAPFVDETRRSLRLLAARYGGYPWSTYTLVVSGDFASLAGTAFSTIGFVGDSSAVLVPHETAHQWFQELVGNNQSRDPWVSEGLATWAQAAVEGSLQAALGTSVPADVRNRLGEPVGFFDRLGFEKLRLGVYVQAVQALASLGDPRAVDCAIRSFVARNAYRVATPADLLDALDDVFPDAETKLRARGARF